MTPPPPPKCGSVGGVRAISQGAFDDLVRENVEDLGMDPAEALQDAIDTLTLQCVNLSGIVTCTPGEGGLKDNPVMRCLEKLKRLRSELNNQVDDSDELVECFEELSSLCSLEGTGNAAIATRNGAVELVCSFYSQIQVRVYRTLNASLKALSPLLHDMGSRELFKDCHGPKTIVGILDESENLETLAAGFSIVAMAATANEILKESFMELKIDELIIRVLTRPGKHCIQSVYDAICVLLAADDNRVVASQVYGYARRFAKVGIAVALVDSLHEGISSPSLVSACIALKAVAVNDEICKNIAENGGIDALLHCIDDSGAQGNKVAARVSCSLLSNVGPKLLLLTHHDFLSSKISENLMKFGKALAGSDMNKNAVVEKKGMDRLIKLSSRFGDDPSILQEVMFIISVLCLRSPDNAARAIEAGAGDLAFQAMQKFPNAQQMQRCSCLMIRNLVVRNPENRTMFLGNGVDKLIRKARQNHECCKDAATDALRDLGLDDYNS